LSSFETRNAGSSFGIEPTLRKENGIVDFHVTSEFLWHTGNTKWQEWEVEKGKQLTVLMPDFYKVSVTTSGVCVPALRRFPQGCQR